MRIGLFTDTYFPQVSGVATSIRVLKEALERQGHTVIIFTTTDPNAKDQEDDVVRLGSIPLLSFKERRVAVQGLSKAFRIAHDYDLDIIHTQTEFSLGLLGKFVGAILEIPTVHTYHTMYEKYLHYIANGKVLKPIHVAYISKNFCNQTQGVIAPSQMTKDKLASYGVLQEIRVVPTGVPLPHLDAQKAQNLRSQLGYGPDDQVLLSLSRLSKEKNIAALIKAFPEVLAQRPQAKLCIVGGGPERPKLEEEVAALELSHAVQFVGEIDHSLVEHYYQMADLYVNASDSESQGLTYIEALVNRIPLVAKENDYLKGFITRPELGLLYQEEDQLAQTILDQLAIQDQGEACQEAFQALEAQVSDDTFANSVLEVYEAAINGYRWIKKNENSIFSHLNLLKLEKDEGDIHWNE